MCLEILVANLATNFQDLVAKVKNLVALATVLGAIFTPYTSELSSRLPRTNPVCDRRRGVYIDQFTIYKAYYYQVELRTSKKKSSP